MTRRSAQQGLVLAFALLTACGNGASDSDAGPTTCEPAQKLAGQTPLPPEVDAVIVPMCQPCHSDPVKMYASMPIVTWEDVQDFAPKHSDGPPVYELMHRRIHDARAPMPPKRQPQLSREQLATLDAWIAQCAPPGSE